GKPSNISTRRGKHSKKRARAPASNSRRRVEEAGGGMRREPGQERCRVGRMPRVLRGLALRGTSRSLRKLRSGCLEQRTALIQPIVNSFTRSFAGKAGISRAAPRNGGTSRSTHNPAAERSDFAQTAS